MKMMIMKMMIKKCSDTRPDKTTWILWELLDAARHSYFVGVQYINNVNNTNNMNMNNITRPSWVMAMLRHMIIVALSC